ncbi:hypothetical protein EHW99_3566 [Erwinia amylovora]|uniref:Uncharacterized protein n=3 Tax=Erwinia amylovora TaxID=552 RepID=A0A831A4N0_ERWAM|nr:hypothetical protein EaACW_3643 [Erwinia amylovora ACW56400]QJQ56265.1 hypothetical protein EHX00_3566 [Erwinia amylovora]CBA24010.1 hypothetical protein predicted by Glimmer/Critica [Erwinia amylovora CFBP1430]CBX82501.1 hypothetical protein predicted by Glimmer/Critica [Erwinia amylovora ATCC BAA-2158]CCO80476.1 hypothetical protein BN432_3709 [Erwinia amylovora Ea356]CCO84286.1 hypothetical protein BN433_3742 [Erwinia amylovora Ea266]CCO88042.1 hypothetical protein BN434_3684 [Erwinia a
MRRFVTIALLNVAAKLKLSRTLPILAIRDAH